jgi:type IV secretion system protein TrbL
MLSVSVCDVPVIASVCQNVGEGAASLITAPFEWIADGLGSLAAYLFESVWQVFDTTTAIDVTATGYRKVYALVFGIGALITLGLFLIQLITALLRREAGAVSRAVTGLAKSILGSAVALTIIGLC